MGPAGGGTVVTVVGLDFVNSEGLSCRVGALKTTRGLWRSVSTIECVMPVHVPGNATLDLSSDGRHFFSQWAEFVFTDALGVSHISPSRGPTAGGTSVDVHVIDEGSASAEYCSFGGVLARAQVANNSTRIRCVTPARRSAGAVDVGVSVAEVQMNGQGMGRTVVFEYEEAMSVRSVVPTSGSVQGGTVVEVRGSGFSLEGRMQCKFGAAVMDAARGAGGWMVLTSSLMRGTSPGGMEGEVTVEVSSNGVDFSVSGVSYRYARAMVLERLEPSMGPAGGGTVVTVVGLDFVNSEGLSCLVGASGTVRGLWRSVSTIECVMPVHVPGNATLEVSVNGLEFSRTGNIHVSRQPCDPCTATEHWTGAGRHGCHSAWCEPGTRRRGSVQVW